MKYTAFDGVRSYSVSINAPHEEAKNLSILAENLYKVNSTDEYCGKTIHFKSKRQFKKFLLWRAIFNQYGPNNTFDFFKMARQAVLSTREIFKKEFIEI